MGRNLPRFASTRDYAGCVAADPTRLLQLRDSVYAPDLLIVAVAELDFFSWLSAHGQATDTDLAQALGLSPPKIDVMLTYFAALGLVERDGPDVTITPVAADCLVEGAQFDLRPYYASVRERPGCVQLLSVLRTGEPAPWSSAPGGPTINTGMHAPAFAERITEAMDARGRFLGPLLAELVAGLGVRSVLDVGGSGGVYASSITHRLPDVATTVFELPPVDAVARTLIAARGDPVDVVAGDMFRGLPTGFDLHLFSHILHDWDESSCRTLLAISYATLPPGGYLVDHDVHVNRDKTGSLPAAEYSVWVMHSTSGKCWSVAELEMMLTDTGFEWVGEHPIGGNRSAIVARKPSSAT